MRECRSPTVGVLDLDRCNSPRNAPTLDWAEGKLGRYISSKARRRDLGALGDREDWIDQALLFRVRSMKYDEGHSAVCRPSAPAMTLMHIKTMLARTG